MRTKANCMVFLHTACKSRLGNQPKDNLHPHFKFLNSRVWIIFESANDFNMFENHVSLMLNLLDL